MQKLFAQIEASAKIDDLDEAVRPIQDILGQEDGGPASMFFSDGVYGEQWGTMTEKRRQWSLIRYCVYELGLMEFSL